MRLPLACAAVALLVCAQAQGQTATKDQPGAPEAASPASKEFMAAMTKMNADMNVMMTGDPDHDFVAMMLPHHQGAIDMARTELHYGKDEQLRDLARQIIADQEKEVTIMRRWQAAHGEKHAE